MRKRMMLGAAFWLATITAGGATAQLADKKVITLAAARKMVAAAEAEAERNHWPGVIAVVDDGGWPILIERMDHAALLAASNLRRVRHGRRPCSRSLARPSRMRSTVVAPPPSPRVALSKCRVRCRSS